MGNIIRFIRLLVFYHNVAHKKVLQLLFYAELFIYIFYYIYYVNFILKNLIKKLYAVSLSRVGSPVNIR